MIYFRNEENKSYSLLYKIRKFDFKHKNTNF